MSGIRNPARACRECGRLMPTNNLGRHEATHDDERREAFRQARNERQRAYRLTEAGQATERRSREGDRDSGGPVRRDRRYRDRHPERYRAHYTVQQAVKRGALAKLPCVVCGSSRQVEGHHHNGYEEEHILDVTWLCNRHHREAHRAA